MDELQDFTESNAFWLHAVWSNDALTGRCCQLCVKEGNPPKVQIKLFSDRF